VIASNRKAGEKGRGAFVNLFLEADDSRMQAPRPRSLASLLLRAA